MCNPMDVRYAIVGAGNGGLAMAGYLAYRGFSVSLYNRTEAKIRDIRENPEIRLSGTIEGTGKLELVTSDISEAISGRDVIMVATPATSHYSLAVSMASCLADGQVIMLNPGRTGGALEVYETLRSRGCRKKVTVAEAQTFIYACRATGTKSARIFSVKHEVAVAAIPALDTEMAVNLLSGAYPQFIPAKSIMETSMNNYGAIFHPAPTLLNSGHIERGEAFEYYLEGITPSIGRTLEKLDMERMKIATALGVKAVSAREWLEETYGVRGGTIYEAIQNNPAYKGLTAPSGLDTRYIYEDVPYSLVPISSMGEKLGIETPVIDTIIRLANIITGRNFFQEGRTVEKLGIKNMSVPEILEFAKTGEIVPVEGEEGEVAAS